ncbi:MAG: hypothetical protein AB199_00075 [Parcubacteria bacterium C7867-004]|nr:MAG: hypothetical protein AB199_00075 [Parcubacteria bacterium C7867-004]
MSAKAKKFNPTGLIVFACISGAAALALLGLSNAGAFG